MKVPNISFDNPLLEAPGVLLKNIRSDKKALTKYKDNAKKEITFRLLKINKKLGQYGKQSM